MLMAQAFSYMDPQWASVMCLMGGRPLVVLPRFSASGFWTSAREHSATLTYVLGAMPMLMWAQPSRPLDRDNSVRLVLCSGIVPDLHRRFEERWGHLGASSTGRPRAAWTWPFRLPLARPWARGRWAGRRPVSRSGSPTRPMLRRPTARSARFSSAASP
jgi:hypothetical protein